MIKNTGRIKKPLSPKDRKELADWLEQMDLDINTIHRKCSDCIVVAKVIKKFYPKMVDLYLYPESNTMKMKLETWNKLTSKVLAKLHLPQKPADIQMYVNQDKEAVCRLLFSIMRLQQAPVEKPKDGGGDADNEADINKLVVVSVDRLVNGQVVKVEQNMINLMALEEARNSDKHYEEAIKKASKKVIELEKKALQKSDEIDELVKILAQQAIKEMEKETETAKELDKKGKKSSVSSSVSIKL